MRGAPLVAVTGGTGFVGRYALAALARAGWRLRMLVRRDPVHPLLADAPMELVLGDMQDAAALTQLVRGADAVVHLAGLTKASDLAGFMRVNRDGTALLAEVVAREAPEARRLLISSLAARAPQLSHYAASKRAGEAAARAAAGGEAWTILRPGVVYGPGDEEGRALRRLVTAPFAAVPGPPEPRIAMIHAADLADAIAALCGAEISGGCYEVSDARHDGYGFTEVLSVTAAAMGRRPPRLLRLPDAVFLAAGWSADLWAKLSGRRGIFGHGKARELLHRDWSADPASLPPATLWTPRIALRDGMAEVVRWWDGGDR
ncbi:NAD-dependent epimerase/dehydratase family protein [Roseomonas marmotae]|uniref:NAD-dependent epimerase/dehydratase family protein n=1 Tax=Roseomonas marmotae TaxID=2768161 RepID=A0ABS3KEK5_9PROT|nr:NAD-dependent epimerase/dehydratase family protein [Roseomonas marmotae]MBO1075878.1 NAD-dependent epimerase/dehydratase family protein [Roseomonas marmotae]QTI81934.1 NAD-dependent epimerase/dehydratase family protein [Roseomonas marmotae]